MKPLAKIASFARASSAVTAIATVAATLSPSLALAAPGYTLQGSGATGFLGDLETWFAMWVNFATSTFGVMIVVLSLVIAATVWAIAPKSGAVGFGVRACVAGVVIFNLATVIAMFSLGTSA
ncbi:MAG TPA: hypothetical protein VGU69_10385 [Rhizomicrobium sp.]|nr:hypothetical protein [Rhizomicrobium sp.]